MTVRDLIKGSLRLIGVLASGESPTADMANDGLSSLNDLLGEMSASGFVIFKKTREVLTLIPSQQTYTIGEGGDFDTQRPVLIEKAKILNGNIESSMRILNFSEWAQITDKNLQSSYPSKLFNDNNAPLASLSFYPVPNLSVGLVLYCLKPITEFTSINDTVQFPPGYSKALRYNLALEIAPEYGRTPSDLIIKIANDSKANIQRQNIEPQLAVSDAIGIASCGRFNFLTGERE